MPDKYINLEELSQVTQSLLIKINEQADLKVNKTNVVPIVNEGTKIAEIEGTELYAPDPNLSNYPTYDDLATVATSGSYNDLSNKPTIPSKTSDLTNDSDFITSDDIPTIPSKTSDLTNDSGFITSSNLPDTSNFMVKGTDYVTAGKKSGTTLGTKATAEGNNTTASATCSHAEGGSTTASGNYSHAEGASTTASGLYSHAEGSYTTAQRKSQHVFGEFNILDTTSSSINVRGDYVEIVGNGTSGSARSNARTLDWSGNEVLAGKLTMGAGPTADMDAATKQYVDTSITTAIGGINQFGVAIVSDLPTTNIDTHTIYFKSNSSSGNNVYDEYMYINSNWELIGSTQIDLTPYAQTADLATVATTGSYADLLNAPAAEDDENVEDMLDSFDLDYTSNSISPNIWTGGSY